jgi:hypothetical protein
MNYKLFIEKFTEYLINFDYADEVSIIGASLKEINKLEKKYNLKLPEIYIQFLLKMGKKAGGFCRGSDMFFPTLFDIQVYANEILEDDNSILFPLKNKFAFFNHSGDFLFFPTDQGDNPPVYGYKPQIEYESFLKEFKKYQEENFGIQEAKKFHKFLYCENGGKLFESFSDYLIHQLDMILNSNKLREYKDEYKEMIESFKLSY